MRSGRVRADTQGRPRTGVRRHDREERDGSEGLLAKPCGRTVPLGVVAEDRVGSEEALRVDDEANREECVATAEQAHSRSSWPCWLDHCADVCVSVVRAEAHGSSDLRAVCTLDHYVFITRPVDQLRGGVSESRAREKEEGRETGLGCPRYYTPRVLVRITPVFIKKVQPMLCSSCFSVSRCRGCWATLAARAAIARASSRRSCRSSSLASSVHGATSLGEAAPKWERKADQPLASWLSGGLSQHQITLQAAPSLGQPRPISRLGRAGRPHRACSRHAERPRHRAWRRAPVLPRASRGLLRTVRTGCVHQPPARCT